MSRDPCRQVEAKRGRDGPAYDRWRQETRLKPCALLLLIPLVIGLLVSVLPMEAQQLPRAAIAVVQSRTLPPYAQAMRGFEEELKARGFRPYLVPHDLKGDPAKVASVVAQLSASPPDLVLALGSMAAVELKKAVPKVPIVFAMVLEPDAYGLSSVGRQGGGGVTGVSMDVPPRLQLEALQRVLPQAKRIGVLYDPEETGRTVGEVGRAAEALGLSLLTEPVRNERAVPRAFFALSPRVDVFLAIPDATVYTESSTPYLLLQALRRSQAYVGLLDSFVKAGALMTLSVDYTDLGRQAGGQAVRILKGASPGEVPVEPPRATRLLLNLRTAKLIDVTIPPLVLEDAEVLVPSGWTGPVKGKMTDE